MAQRPVAGDAVLVATGRRARTGGLGLTRRSDLEARTQAANQLHAVVTTAPDQLRARLAGLTTSGLVGRAARLRSGDTDNASGGSGTTPSRRSSPASPGRTAAGRSSSTGGVAARARRRERHRRGVRVLDIHVLGEPAGADRRPGPDARRDDVPVFT